MPKKGEKLSLERRQQISNSLRKRWEGLSEAEREQHRAVRRGWSPNAEQRERLSMGVKASYASGKHPKIRVGNRKGAVVSEGARQKMREAKLGKKQTEQHIRNRMSSWQRSFEAGRITISPNSGWAGRFSKRMHYPTPFQGVVRFRSSSEFQRALELDALGLVWFYEAHRFPMEFEGHQTSYLPDFWILPNMHRRDFEKGCDIREFLETYTGEIILEDVKGWWGSKHSSFKKIQEFRQQYPELRLDIVVRGGIAGRYDVSAVEKAVLGAKGEFFITLTEGSGDLLELRHVPNIIVLDASLLIAQLLRDPSSRNSANMLCVGTGASGAILSPDAPDARQRSLNAEIERKPWSSTTYRDANGNAVAIPTNVVDFTVVFDEAEAVGTLNEMGIMSTISDNPAVQNLNPDVFPTRDVTIDTSTLDVLLNYITFAPISKPATARLSITWRITF